MANRDSDWLEPGEKPCESCKGSGRNLDNTVHLPDARHDGTSACLVTEVEP
jgi:hypothetical protein